MTPEQFKSAVGKFPTGVTVISTKYQDQFFGFTANSFVSVSLAPPLVLFCLNKKAGSFAAFLNSNYFTISILSDKQSDIASHFASRHKDKFDSMDFSLSPLFEVPLINHSCSWIECAKYQQIDAGDHYIFVGEAKNTKIDAEKSPLLYFAKSFLEVK